MIDASSADWVECAICGACVVAVDVHEQWHLFLAESRATLAAMSDAVAAVVDDVAARVISA